MNTLQESTQAAIKGLDRLPTPAVLFGCEGQVLGANAEARSLFNPLRSHEDLPPGFTAGMDEALSKGCRSFSCCNAQGRTWRRALYPEYFDPERIHRPTGAVLRLETKTGRAIPEHIAVSLYRELHDGCKPLSTSLQDPAFAAANRHEVDSFEAREQAERHLLVRTSRVAHALLALVGDCGAEKTEATVRSLIVEAVDANDGFYASQFRDGAGKMRLSYQGSDSAFTTCNLRRLKAIFAEILVDLRRWSRSVSVLWAEDQKTLRAPAIKIEFGFQELSPTLVNLTSRNAWLGWPVAAEVVLDATGYMEVRPGKPASLRLWLPATLPDGF